MRFKLLFGLEETGCKHDPVTKATPNQFLCCPMVLWSVSRIPVVAAWRPPFRTRGTWCSKCAVPTNNPLSSLQIVQVVAISPQRAGADRRFGR
jgi:hypothetical protein